jgi:aminopeptidase N
MTRAIVCALVAMIPILASQHGSGDSPQPGPGVPLGLAEERAHRVSNLRYELRFLVPRETRSAVAGEVTIHFTLTNATRPLALDFTGPPPAHASVNGRDVSLIAAPEHLILQSPDLREGSNDVTVAFSATDAALNRNTEFMYTLFVPARARLTFPCFDQPDLKARYALTLDIPSEWQALSNGAERSRAVRDSRAVVRFAETEPLSTYLFAFAAGKFQIETAQRNGRTFRMFHRETDAKKVERNRDAVFDLHAAALDWLERYTGIPYRFGKFDFLLVPSFQFGGMEHPGAIFYNASGILLDESATQNQKLGRASVISHETAHMWFGDLVTMRWFNDVWMKEVFANFMAAKIVNPSFPEINHELRFLLSYYPEAYDVDRTAGTNPIRQRLDNLNEAGTLYGAIIYQKAPIVMRQLEMILGEDSFRDGLREYLNAHAFANAAWTDLVNVLDARTLEDLAAWSHAWVEEPGRPTLATELRVEHGTIAQLAFTERDPAPRRGLEWTQHIEAALGYAGEIKKIGVNLSGASVEVAAARGLGVPLYVLPNGGGIAYGGVALDETSRAYLLQHLADIPDALTRGSALVALWEDMLDGRSRAGDVLHMLIASLPAERDELNVQRMLSYLEHGYWTFLSASARDALAPSLERTLRAGIAAASTQSLKSAWFSALRNMALTADTLEWLERVWDHTEPVPGLTLAEPDYIRLAQELALRGGPDSDDILSRQLTRIENPDRKARFEFTRSSLSRDPAVRDALFNSFADVERRRHEPWVLEALGYLHHPLRGAASEKYIPPSLAMLQEIQRTGDIFFPKRWMDATLSGHSSSSAARMVTAFLANLPANYPDRLRRIVLSSADDLFRTTR